MPSNGRTLDEFAVPEEAQEMMTQHRPRIEQLFGVELNVLGVLGSAQSPNGDPQGARKIWLQLQGHRENLQRAKDYIKGLCTPELSEEVYYPKDMHCIFLGAHRLFLDCLTRGTSANITLLRPGALLVSGLAEAFVMAQSRIQEFVEKHQKNPKLQDEREAQVKRAFRELVESYDDKHAMDLLILPTSVKEELLSLVKEIQDETREQRTKNGCWMPPRCGGEWPLGWEVEAGSGSRPQSPRRPQNILGLSMGLSRVQEQSRLEDSGVDLPAGFQESSAQDSTQPQYSARPRDFRTDLPVLVGRPQDQAPPLASRVDLARGFVEAEMHSRPQDVSAGLNPPQRWPDATAALSPALPKPSPKPIPTAMATPKAQTLPGYGGLTESLENHLEQGENPLRGRESSPVSLPEESSEEEEEEEEASDVLLSSWTEKEFKMRLNFFKTMGYEERVVKKVLLEGGVRQAPSTILDRVQMEEAGLAQKDVALSQNEPGRRGLSPPLLVDETPDENEYLREIIKAAAANCGHSLSEIPAEIQTGAPLAGLLRRLNEKGEHQDEAQGATGASPTKPEHGDRRVAILNHDESSQRRSPQERGRSNGSSFREGVHSLLVNPEVAAFSPNTSPSTNSLFSTSDSGENQSTESASLELLKHGSVSTVTGAQRFEEALQMQFKLKLANTPGKKNLRRIIIDGSNVAMMHGLNQFFSCRGIALAVQYFWDRGHREVTVLVPAYRLEEDSNVREQHFLVELKELSILSVTPSRKIDGKGIVPYDDRFMLQLAEQTNGVIVTNDQFRDLAKESKKWIRIIKESLLQYIFVENIFMVPDDPLGRAGPTLVEFLKKNSSYRTKGPNCHSFNGRVPAMPVPVRPASQTEVLQLRDRRPPGGLTRERWRQQKGSTVETEETLRPTEETEQLRRDLLEIFVDQDTKVDFVLMRDPCCRDLNKLSEAVLNLRF